jgi:hypothetical protein
VDRKEPGANIKNSKYGLRWNDVIGSFEYTLNFLYGWDTGATKNKTIIDTSTSSLGFLPVGIPFRGSTFRIHKRYQRIRMWGGSFSKTFVSGKLRGLTLRGEFAYVNDKVVTYMGNDGRPHQKRIDTFSYVIGIDKYIVTNWLVSFQFFQKILSQKYAHGNRFMLPGAGKRHRIENYFSLKVSTDFFHERLKPEVLVLYGDYNDWRISPLVGIEWGDHITSTIGVHILEGKKTAVFGEFKEQKQLYFEIKYSF